MIFGPVLAAALYAAQVGTPPPEQPSPPPPSMGTSAAVWCPAKGACSEGVAIPVGSWRSIFRHGSGQLLFLVGSKSAGGAVAHVFASSPHLSVAVGLGAVVPYEQQAGIRGALGVMVGVLEIKP